MSEWLRTGRYHGRYPLADYLQTNRETARKIAKAMDAEGLVYRVYGPAIVKAEDVDAFLERRNK